ncbi:hypothetical protein WJX77_011417 [Trebouxia sp. C0004]
MRTILHSEHWLKSSSEERVQDNQTSRQSLPPVFDQVKRQRIQQQRPPPASINKFVWTEDEDNSEEIERLTLRLTALIGWDDFPSDLELRDVHTQTLFDARLEDESNRVEITESC